MAALGLGAALVLGVGAVGLQARAGATAEAATGLSPARPFGPAEPAVLLTFSPFLTGAMFSRRFGAELTYGPRLFFRFPSLVGRNEPMLLHGLQTVATWQLSRRTRWHGSASADYGEFDFLELSDVIETDAASRVDTTRIGLFGLAATTGVSHTFSRRYEAGLSGGWARSDFRGDTGALPLPTTETVHLGVDQSLRLSRADTLGADTGVARTHTVPGLDYDSAHASVDWQHTLAPRASTTLGAGVSAFQAQTGEVTASPTATGSARSFLGQTGTMAWSGSAAASLTATLDPLTGRPREAASLQLGLTGDDAPWTYAATATVGTTLGDPTAETGRGPERHYSGQLSAARAYRPDAVLTFGVRASYRPIPDEVSLPMDPEVNALGFVAFSFGRVIAGVQRPR